MKKIFTHLFAVLLMLSSTSWAQLSSLEVGQVYRFVNVLYPTYSLNANSATDVNAVTTNETDTKQQWYVESKEGEYYVLRNLAYGKYLKGNGQSTAWSLSDDYSDNYNKFKLYSSNVDYNTLHTNTLGNYAYMHSNSSQNIVGWSNSATDTGSHWTITKVDYTSDEITALLEKAPTVAEIAAYGVALAALFKDGACTELKDEYTSMSVEDIKADANYKALPAVLQNTVLKIKNNNWGEANAIVGKEGWDSDYAKKFRVQMYEPYSIENDITSYLRINAHSNMDNPTGLYANDGQKIYVMVDGEIQEGSELWLVHQKGFGATHSYGSDEYNNEYTRLQSGLNVIPFTVDAGVLWINYLVDTYNADGATIAEKFPANRKLSEYKPIKIHIEGGYINGYYNAIGDFRATDTGTEDLWGAVDNDDDWDYYKERAPLNGTDAPNRDFPLLGHRQTLLFPLGQQANDGGGMENGLLYHLDNIAELPKTPNCYGGNGNTFGTFEDSYPGMGLNTSNGKINIMLEAWDRITYSEFATMGLVSTSTMDKMNEMYPRWTAQGTPAEIYNYGAATVNNETKTYLEFCQGVDYSEYFNHHACGVGAPSGYMSGGWRNCNYHYNTMESIIGKIASEAGPTWGPAHEIGHQNQAVFNLNGQTEITNNFFSNVAVWYMGMGTSRVNGSEGSLASVLEAFNTKDNDLYTNNIWAITHLYYRLWLYYHLAGNNTQFWPRLFELLRQTPMVNGGQISGETSLLRFYQHACDAAGEDLTEFFRAHGFFELMTNRFVGDYSNAIYNVTEEQIETAITAVKEKNYPVNYAVLLINDGTDVTTPKHNGVDKRALWDVDNSDNPIYTAEFGSVNDFITGNVATAYTATLNSDGTVTMSDGTGGVGFLVLNEKGEIVSFSNKSTFALGDEAMLAIVSGKAKIVSVSSDNDIAPVEADFDLSAIKKEVLGILIADVEAVIANVDDTFTKVGYYKPAAVVDLQTLLNAAKDVYANGSAYEGAYEMLYSEYRNVIDNPNSLVGVISGKKYAIKNRGGDDYMTMQSDTVVTTGDPTLPTTDDNLWIIETSGENYHIKHAGTGKYLQGVSDANDVRYTVGSTAVNYMMTRIENAYYALSTAEHPTRYMNRHNSSNVATWNSTDGNSQWTITLVETVQDVEAIANLELLVSKTRSLLDKVADVDYTGDAYPLQADDSSADFYITSNATESGHEPKYLLDNTTGTFFHTVWASGSPGEAHYLQIDLGEENKIDQFVFSYSTIGQKNVDAPEIIEVKGSNSPNSDFQAITTLTSLPTTHLTSYTSDVLGSVGTKYRYLRFTVTDATGGKLGEYYYFGISELAIRRNNYKFNNLRNGYESVDNSVVTAAIEEYEAARQVVANGSGYADALSELQIAYNNLLAEYNNVLATYKRTLEELIDATKPLLVDAGTVEFGISTPLELTEENLYCNEVRTEDCASNGATGDTSSTGYVKNLTDGNHNTFLHTNYNNNQPVNAPHYLRVDLGENSTVKMFKFNYVTRDNGNNCPSTIEIEGCNEADGPYTRIETLTRAADELPDGESLSFESSVIPMDYAYRYVRFKVTSTEGSSNPTFFVMAEFGFSTVVDNVSVKDDYAAVLSEDLLLSTYFVNEASKAMCESAVGLSVELLKAQIADQTAAKAALEEAMAKKARADLAELIQATQELCDEMSTPEGAVAEYYLSSSLTADNLAAVAAEIADADAVCKNLSATYVDIKAAYTELEAEYNMLKNIKDADVVDREQLTGLIDNMQSLLGEVADKTTAKTAIALQVDDDERAFYIWSNATAGDCDGIGALIDKNDDASANTGTFFGTVWQGGAVTNYSHYITVDLGTEIALSELSIDYTTRNSTHANQRPTSIKILGSNDKEGEYAEITHLSEGMPVGQCVKWEMDGTVALNGYYRYIRFAVATEMGYFNMSDFNLYAHSALVTNSNYQPAVTGEQLYAMNVALLDGIAARDKFVTEDNYNVAVTALKAQYDALLAIKNANKTDKDELETLVTETNELVTEVATVNDTESAITLQCDNENAPYYIFCNAPEKSTTYPGDNLGVAALLDVDEYGEPVTSTHLHTAYSGNDAYDDLDHYLRVDMGENEALAAFKFNYVGRVGNTDNAPKTIVIEGSNDRENFEKITTLKNLPTADNATYQSDVITNGKAYRYIRFMVTETSNGSDHNGHDFFALSHFSVTACKTIKVAEDYVSPNLPLSTLVTANNEVVDGTTVKEQFYVTQDLYDSTVAELQAAKDALEAAKLLKNIPVKLTTDVNNPVLYKIYINRAFNNSAVDLLAYDGESKVDVADLDFESTVQNWYFMQGTDENSYGDVLILPATADGKALATNSFSEGAGTVSAQEPATEGYSYNWEINQIADKEWYNIKMNNGSDTYYYFSNHSGSGYKMGFYNSNTSTDGGSMFRFVLADAYSVLKDCYEPLEKEPEVYAPGYFSNAEQYNAAYDAASEYVNFANGTEEQYIAAYNELFAQKKALTTRTPSHALEDGAVYRIMNLITKTEPGYEYHYIKNNNASITFPTIPAEDKSDLWVCKANEDGTYEFVSALGTATLGWNEDIKETNAGAVKENATKFVVATGVANGAKRMAVNNNSMSLTNELWGEKGEALFNRAGSNGSTQSDNWSTDWYFQKVDNADIKFKVKITKKFSSLYLPYSVVVPDGVGAFTAVDVDGTAVELVRVADKLDSSRHGTIIPARTPVVVYIEDENVVTAEYEFEYTTEDANLPDDVQLAVDNDAIIYGKILKTPVQCEGAYRYYKLGSKSGDEVAKMYWMYKEYNASGERLYPNTDDGTHISCTANKIYMKVPETLAANSFTMRFAKGDGTTDIDNVKEENGNVKTIYDLQGHKLSEITEPGIYIVDGKKVFVK